MATANKVNGIPGFNKRQLSKESASVSGREPQGNTIFFILNFR